MEKKPLDLIEHPEDLERAVGKIARIRYYDSFSFDETRLEEAKKQESIILSAIGRIVAIRERDLLVVLEQAEGVEEKPQLSGVGILKSSIIFPVEILSDVPPAEPSLVLSADKAMKAQSPIGKRIYDGFPNEILLLEEFVTGVGSIVEADRQPHDIDILYRQDTRNQYLERRVGEHIPQDLRPYVHIIYDSRGKHGPGLPFYDLMLKKRAKLEVLPHAYKIQLFKPIPMAKPVKLDSVKLEELS